jgi:hypothetical protein
MVVRRMRAVAGCVVAVAVVAAAATAATAAGDGGGSPGVGAVPQVPAFAWEEAQSVKSVADLRDVSAAARSLVTTPTVEIVKTRRVASGSASTFASGTSKARKGCSDVWLSTTRVNAFGDVLMSARTTIRNWCADGRRVTSRPTVQRSVTAHWGWSVCGWNAAYAGWLRDGLRYGAGGNPTFAYGASCASAQPQMHHDVQVKGDGTYAWSY